jgi:potassium/hydrogen antiporter
MYPVDLLVLLAGGMLVVAILSLTLSGRLAVPGLVLFMGIGMLAGEDGIGRFPFDNHPLAHAVGTFALVLILFDGGLRTPWSSFRRAWKPAATLATVGVVLTAGVTGMAAAWILGLPLLLGLLLGSIVGSTDAAAVFSILRGQGLRLRQRLASTLEIESGSNDPMAILLTLGCVWILIGDLTPGWELAGFFLQQAGLGAVGGLAVGWLGIRVVSRIPLNSAGLYPLLTLGVGLLAYGIPAFFGGSGFLAVYLAGLVLGNSRMSFKREVLLAHDSGAWMAQISMFVMLGLLATPSRLLDVAMEGLLMAVVLALVARPAAVFLSLAGQGFSVRELTFLSWAGLKGAIPIILAIYPLLLGVEEGELLLDVVFFVVLFSALTQGWTLGPVARWLGVREEPPPEPPVTLEISALSHVDGDIVEYRVDGDAFAAGRLVRELALPESAVLAMIAREQEVIPPRGTTRIQEGDHVFVVLKPEVRPIVDRMFSPRKHWGKRIMAMEFPLDGRTRVGDLEEFYGIHLDPDPDRSVASLMRERLGAELVEGAEITAGELRLAAREVRDGEVEVVGVEILLEEGGR